PLGRGLAGVGGRPERRWRARYCRVHQSRHLHLLRQRAQEMREGAAGQGRTPMRRPSPIPRLLPAILCAAAAASAQGLRDYTGPVPDVKPAMSCSALRALTSYDLTVISALNIPAAGEVPQHCRVSLMVQPSINIEVNLPTAWNGRFYMFGNGG